MNKGDIYLERRYYRRISVDASGTLILKNGINSEVVGKIDDISESGFKVIIDITQNEKIMSMINEGDEFDFQALEKFDLYGKENSSIFNGKAVVVRKMLINTSLILGCKMNGLSPSTEKYISEKKLSSYIKSIKESE